MTFSERAVEAAAKAISEWDGSGWDTILGSRECERNRYRLLADKALTAALAVDGLALVQTPLHEWFRAWLKEGHKNISCRRSDIETLIKEVDWLRAALTAASDGEVG